jgi:hypothetical protein
MYWLYVSIALNAVFLLLLFFKSALNRIVEEWWLDKKKRKREQHERLVELRSDLSKIRFTYPKMLYFYALAKLDKDEATKEKDIQIAKEMGSEMSPILNSMKRNEVYFSLDIRTELANLPKLLADVTVSLMLVQAPNRDDLLFALELMNQKLDELVSIVEGQLGR